MLLSPGSCLHQRFRCGTEETFDLSPCHRGALRVTNIGGNRGHNSQGCHSQDGPGRRRGANDCRPGKKCTWILPTLARSWLNGVTTAGQPGLGGGDSNCKVTASPVRVESE